MDATMRFSLRRKKYIAAHVYILLYRNPSASGGRPEPGRAGRVMCIPYSRFGGGGRPYYAAEHFTKSMNRRGARSCAPLRGGRGARATAGRGVYTRLYILIHQPTGVWRGRIRVVHPNLRDRPCRVCALRLVPSSPLHRRRSLRPSCSHQCPAPQEKQESW